MNQKRAGGIVAAVTLTIVTAFAVVIVLVLNESVSVAKRYAESTTDLYASEVASGLESFMRRQYAVVSSARLDDDLVEALRADASGATSQDVSALLEPMMEGITTEDGTRLFVASVSTYRIYFAGGTCRTLATNGGEWKYLRQLVNQNSKLGSSAKASTVPVSYFVTHESSREGRESSVLVGAPVMDGEDIVGVVGIRVGTHKLAQVIKELTDTQSQSAVWFLADGIAIVSTNPDVMEGSKVFVALPQIASLEEQLSTDSSEPVRLWIGVDGLLPRDQELYQIQYNEEFGSYLLVTNTAQKIFDQMRARSSTLVFALSVVSVLLLFLVVGIVRFYRARIMRVMTTDELTGLANRKSFVSSYEAMVEAQELDDATLILVDVDKFKQINDTYGHAAGDIALAAVAAEVRRAAGQAGLAGRWGGDEFIGILRAPTDEALVLAQDIIDRVAALELEGGIRVTVSVGAAKVDPTQPLERMVDNADDALYSTKRGGRGYLTAYVPGVTPHAGDKLSVQEGSASKKPAAVRDADGSTPRPGEVPEHTGRRKVLDLVIASLLEAVRHMVPFVAGGGILIAIAFLIDGASVDLNVVTAEVRANFGSITPIAANLKTVGSAAFNFMLPIFAAFLARGLAGEDAFMAGFAGGYLASQGSSGFAGAICAALVTAGVVRLMCGFVNETQLSTRRIAPVLLYPVFSLLIMFVLMMFVIDSVASAFDAALTAMLRAIEPMGDQVLGAACGAMMATDMGGPINKAAYHFGTASIAAGSPQIMASVMVGGMVPPCGIALCMLLFRNRFTDAEHDQAAATFVMGLGFITEGAIPFVLTDFLRVIPSCMAGSAVAGWLSAMFGCTLMAPHGGIFVFPVVGNAPMYLVALAAGSLVTALVLGLLKHPKAEVA